MHVRAQVQVFEFHAFEPFFETINEILALQLRLPITFSVHTFHFYVRRIFCLSFAHLVFQLLHLRRIIVVSFAYVSVDFSVATNV